MEDERWPSEWLRGVLELCVLGALQDGPSYGYAIAQRLERAGLGIVKGGTLYPLLGRLEADQLVDASWEVGESGPGRKYFTLTGAGRDTLCARSARWREFVEITAAVLDTAEPARGPA